TGAGLDLADQIGESIDVGEVAVHGGEAHVGDLVEITQFVHDQLTELAAGNLALSHRQQATLDAVDGCLDGFGGDRTFAQGEGEAGGELVVVELAAVAIAFDDLRHLQIDAFVGREALVAGDTATTATYDVAFIVLPGIRHLGVGVVTE